MHALVVAAVLLGASAGIAFAQGGAQGGEVLRSAGRRVAEVRPWAERRPLQVPAATLR